MLFTPKLAELSHRKGEESDHLKSLLGAADEEITAVA